MRPSESQLAAMSAVEIHALGDDGKPRKKAHHWSGKPDSIVKLQGDSLAWIDPTVNRALICAITREAAISPKTTRHRADGSCHKKCAAWKPKKTAEPRAFLPKACACTFGKACARYKPDGSITRAKCKPPVITLPRYQPHAWYAYPETGVIHDGGDYSSRLYAATFAPEWQSQPAETEEAA